MAGVVLQTLDPAAGSPLAYAGTFLLAAAFYATTAHLAARYVLGDVPLVRAAVVGAVLAAVSVALQRFGPLVVIGVTIVVDFVTIRTTYRLAHRTAALVTLVHYTVSVILGITVYNLISLLATAPG